MAEVATIAAGSVEVERRAQAAKQARGQFRPTISVVIPAFNEAGNVGVIAAQLSEILAGVGTWEIIFVDDGSVDGTLEALKALAQRDPRIRFISFTRNFGHQAALQAGLRHAQGAAVIVMDCDLEHPPQLIPELIAAWRGGAKVVTAQRRDDPAATGLFKRVTSGMFYRLMNAIGDVRIEAGSADFMLLDRVAVDAISRFETSDVFLRGLVRWLGYAQVRIPYTQGTRTAGESKYSMRKMIDFAIFGIVSHSLKPLRIAIYLSAVFALLGVGLLVYSVVSFLFVPRTVVGWSSIMAAIAILGAGQFFMLGVIGEYIGRILRETRKWPTFLVEETEAALLAQANDPPFAVGPRDLAAGH
ncbi:MAG TPA: glycosyltransferase family 2 protein [Caulobacteraceae bacterium]|jgi:dolichol-phosphate mannosyltransferase